MPQAALVDAANEVVANATPAEVEIAAGNGTPAQVSAVRTKLANKAITKAGALRAAKTFLPYAGAYAAGAATSPLYQRVRSRLPAGFQKRLSGWGI